MIKTVKIGNHYIGKDLPCFIIAEAGVNHNGKIEIAHKLIEEASKAGVDAVKFQSFITEELVTFDAPKAKYQIKTTGEHCNQYKMLKDLEISAKQQEELKAHCRDSDILYLCTPYDKTSVDMLDKMNIAAFKIASTDINNIPFLRYIAKKGRPVILSTGMSSLGEVEQAYFILKDNGLADKIIILHCTSEYPTPVNDVNLKAILTIQQAFNCPVGFSDHTAGINVSTWANVIGACVIEKHFTLDRNMTGPDHRASIEPKELEMLVKSIREVEDAMGDGIKHCMKSEINNKLRMQKSLVAYKNIHAGEIIMEEHLTSKRPGFGLQPFWFDRIIGKKASKEIYADTLLDFSCFEWE